LAGSSRESPRAALDIDIAEDRFRQPFHPSRFARSRSKISDRPGAETMMETYRSAFLGRVGSRRETRAQQTRDCIFRSYTSLRRELAARLGACAFEAAAGDRNPVSRKKPGFSPEYRASVSTSTFTHICHTRSSLDPACAWRTALASDRFTHLTGPAHGDENPSGWFGLLRSRSIRGTSRSYRAILGELKRVRSGLDLETVDELSPDLTPR
jgi:hypothetical protein